MISKYILSNDQQRAYSAVESGENVLILGTGGSGKSVLAEVIKDNFGHETIFCGTTGVSSQMLFNGAGGNGTISSVMSLPIGIHNDGHRKNVTPRTARIMGSTAAVKKVCLDEAGMLTPDQIDLFIHRIHRYNKATPRRPARNIQIILMGDLLQLPCVLAGEEPRLTMDRYGTTLFFKTKAFGTMKFRVVYLDKSQRTKDEEFKKQLECIRYGDWDNMPEALDYFNERVVKAPDDIPSVYTRRKEVDAANMAALKYNTNPCGEYEAEIEKEYDMENCPCDAKLYLKVGMPVLTLINHSDGIFSNGSTGVVMNITEEGVYVRFSHSDETHLVEGHRFSEKETYVDGTETLDDGTTRDLILTREVGAVTQIPLKVCSAMTVHRTQGKTLQSPYLLDLGFGFGRGNNAFGIGMAYTGLSRATKVENIYLTRPLTNNHIRFCPETIEWLAENNALGSYFDRR